MAVSPDRRKLLRAVVASAAAGAVIYLLVMQWALPAVQARVTPAQVEWLRDAMKDHLVAVLFAIVAIAALLGSASADGFPLGVWSHGWEETDYTRWVTLR